MKFFTHENNENFPIFFFVRKHLIKLCVKCLYACLLTFFFFLEEKIIIFFSKKNLSKKILSPDKVIATKKQGNWQINKRLRLVYILRKFYINFSVHLNVNLYLVIRKFVMIYRRSLI